LEELEEEEEEEEEEESPPVREEAPPSYFSLADHASGWGFGAKVSSHSV